MKLAPRARRIFWDVHAGSGVVASLVLYVMFFMGAFAPFYPEIDAWAEPNASAAAPFQAPALTPLLEQLERERGFADVERVVFRLERHGLRASVREHGEYAEYRFDPASGRLEPVLSGLGSFLHSMHYLGPLPYGIWLAGIAAMGLSLALASGFFIHFGALVRQLFQFRPERPRRIWASDAHKVLGVFGLPFQILYAWTGAVLVLGYLVVEPALLHFAFGADEAALRAARDEPPGPPERSGGRAARLPDVDALLRGAAVLVPGTTFSSIALEHVGAEACVLNLRGVVAGRAFGAVELQMRAGDGSVVDLRTPDAANAYRRFDAWFRGLHYASFGSYLVQLLYAVLAFATCGTIVSGNVVWLDRRDPQRVQIGNRLLERLTAGVCAGVILATSAAFLGTRLLPATLPGRAAVEQRVFWAVFLCAIALPFVWREPRRAAASELLLAGALFGLALASDLVRRPSALQDPVHCAILLGLSLLASATLLAGARLGWRRRPPPGDPTRYPAARGARALE